jgi:hypothetical protein
MVKFHLIERIMEKQLSHAGLRRFSNSIQRLHGQIVSALAALNANLLLA